jgi:hypothetical protein
MRRGSGGALASRVIEVYERVSEVLLNWYRKSRWVFCTQERPILRRVDIQKLVSVLERHEKLPGHLVEDYNSLSLSGI